MPQKNCCTPWYLRWSVIAWAAIVATATVTTAIVNIRNIQREGVFAEPPAELMGWAGKDAAEAAWTANRADPVFRAFQLTGPLQDNRAKRVVIADAQKQVLGDYIETRAQVIGSCVGHSGAQACDAVQVAQIAKGEAFEFKPTNVAFSYAISRCAPECGRGQLGRNPNGSIVSWWIVGGSKYGILADDCEGVPREGDTAALRQWALKMPPRELIDKARAHTIQASARLTTPDEVMDAICNGYACQFGSDYTGVMRCPVVDGRLLMPNRTFQTPEPRRWQHAMCFIGYDGSVPGKRFWLVLNSWGPKAHAEVQPDNTPPGSWWIDEAGVRHIIKYGEVFAISFVNGFPVAPPNWDFNLRDARAKAAKNEAGVTALAL